MDEYGPVDVTRSTEPGDDLDDDKWWSPSSPSNFTHPYGGSPLDLSFSSPVELTSLLVETEDNNTTPVYISIRVKPAGSDEFEDVVNPEDASYVFEVVPGEKFPLPDDFKPGDEIEVRVVGPQPSSPLSVTPFGCEHPGKCKTHLVEDFLKKCP